MSVDPARVAAVQARDLTGSAELVLDYRRGLLQGHQQGSFSRPYIWAKWDYEKGQADRSYLSWFARAEAEVPFPGVEIWDQDLLGYLLSRLMSNPRCCAFETTQALHQQRLQALQVGAPAMPGQSWGPQDITALAPRGPEEEAVAIATPPSPSGWPYQGPGYGALQQPSYAEQLWNMVSGTGNDNRPKTAAATAPETGNYDDADVAATQNAVNQNNLTKPDPARRTAVDPNNVDVNKLPVSNKAAAQQQLDTAKQNRQFIYLTPNMARFVVQTIMPWSKLILVAAGLAAIGALAYFTFRRPN